MKNNFISIGFILGIIALGLLINVGSYGVVETSDARYAEIAREIFRDGDWVHPNLLNVHHYHKPPFTYQITAVAYSLFGVTSFAARFFLQLSVLFQIWLVYQIALLLFRNKNTALLSAAIYASLPLVLISSRNLTTDSFLTSFALLSIYAWLRYYLYQKKYYLYLFAISLALGFYTKGPVIFIIPLVFISIYSFLFPKRYKWNKHHLFSFLVFLILGLWWYVYLAIENQQFIDYFLGKQTLERFAKNSFNRAMPWWYFIVLVPLTAMPWSYVIPYFVKDKWQEIKRNKLIKTLFLSIIIPVFFFSLSTSKRILYILPIYIFIALISAYFIQNSSSKKQQTGLYMVSGFYLLVSLSFILSYFIHIEFKISFWIVLLSVLFVFAIFYNLKNTSFNLQSKYIYNALMFSLFMLIASSKIMAVNSLKINSPKPVTDFIKKEKIDNYPIYIYNSRQPSVAFELDKDIISLYKDARDLNRETQFEQDQKWKNYLINLNQPDEWQLLINKLKKEPGVLITYKEKEQDSILKILKAYYSHRKDFEKYTVYY